MCDLTSSANYNMSGVASHGQPGRRIISLEDIDMWLHSEAYKDYTNFIKQLNDFSKRVHSKAFNSRDEIKIECLQKVVGLLDQLSQLSDDVEPFDHDAEQRFGNKAYRVWFDKVNEQSEIGLVEIFGERDGLELALYLRDSFGNKTRIDYGTGHEMCFVIFLMGIYKLALIPQALEQQKGDNGETLARSIFEDMSRQLLTIFAIVYMPLVRKVQLRYRLEPAGSHGAFSLDDFQFLPFYFGSAQLIGHSSLDPSSFPQEAIADQNKDKYMFYAAVAFIHQVKKGPFAEHSNQLWNISGVDDWAKINNGLYKMYCNEYLPKVPIVQHLIFGDRVLVWKRENDEDGLYLEKHFYRWIDESKVSWKSASIEGDQLGLDEMPEGVAIYKFTYHIVYSDSYQVPTLYFMINDQNGSAVTLQWIWERVPKEFLNISDSHKNKQSSGSETIKTNCANMITQMAHPFLHIPFYFVHPCYTSTFMDQVRQGMPVTSKESDSASCDNYLISWLSILSNVVGLEMPLGYAS